MVIEIFLIVVSFASHVLSEPPPIDLPVQPNANPSVLGGGVAVLDMRNGPIHPAMPLVAEKKVQSPVEKKKSKSTVSQLGPKAARPGYGYAIGEIYPIDEYQRRSDLENKHLSEMASITGKLKPTSAPSPPCKIGNMHGQPAAGMNYKDLYNVKYSEKGPYGYVQRIAGGTDTQNVSLNPPLKLKEEQQKKIETNIRKRLGDVLGDFSAMLIRRLQPISFHKEMPDAGAAPIAPAGSSDMQPSDNTPFHYAPPEVKPTPILGLPIPSAAARTSYFATLLLSYVTVTVIFF